MDNKRSVQNVKQMLFFLNGYEKHVNVLPKSFNESKIEVNG